MIIKMFYISVFLLSGFAQAASDNSNWIFERLESLGGIAINQIKFPGAHDADSSQITDASAACKDAVSEWAPIADLFGIARAYSNSQGAAATLPALAKAGVRFFDLRVCLYKGEYYGAHGLVSAPLFDKKLLGGLSDFAKSHPSELIFVRFQSQGSLINHSSTARSFSEEFIAKFGDSLISPVGLSPKSTLNEVLSEGSVIAVWDLDSAPAQEIWPGSSMPYSWPDSTGIDAVLSREEAAVQNRTEDTFFVSYLDMTPTLGYILMHLFSSLLSMEESMNKVSMTWFSNLPASVKSKFNIIAFDAVLFDLGLVDEIIKNNDDLDNLGDSDKLQKKRSLRGF